MEPTAIGDNILSTIILTLVGFIFRLVRTRVFDNRRDLLALRAEVRNLREACRRSGIKVSHH